MKKYIAILTAISMFALAGCAMLEDADKSQALGETSQAQSDTTADDMPATDTTTTAELDFPSDDYLKYLGESVTFSDGDEILITESGSYEFTGDYTSSTINVNVDKDTDEGVVYLVLNGANITSDTSTPINIIEAKDVVIVLEGENTVTQGAITTTDEEFPSGAVHSQADTVITGEGSLVVNTLYMDGINSRDDLIIENTTITVNAVEHGIEGKDLLAIDNANINVTSGRDGIRTSNDEDLEKGNLIITSGNFVVNAQHDGIVAEQTLQIDGGNFDITTGGGFVEVLNEITRGEGSGDTVSATDLLEDSMRSLKGTNIIISGGEFVLNSYEDTVHANGVLTINGGVFDILSGDDALHADTDLVINDADVVVQNGYEGIEGETVTINGGDINVTVLDDAMNANSDTGFIKITGGTIFLKCSGDGIDSNGDLIIEGGDIVIDVDALYSGGDGALDVSGTYTISGGSVTDENGNEISSNTSAPGGGGGGGGGGGMMPPSNNGPGGNRPRV